MTAEKKSVAERARELKKDGKKPAQMVEILKKEGYKTKLGKPIKVNNVYAYFDPKNPRRVKGLKRVQNPQVSAQLDAITALTGVKTMADDQRLAIIRKIVS